MTRLLLKTNSSSDTSDDSMEGRRYTRYERTRIISARALQIAQGSPVLVKAPKELSPIEVAKMEWDKGVVPIDIKKREVHLNQDN